MIKLTIEQVIRLHEKLIEKTGGSAGVLNMQALSSSISAPFQTFDGVELYPTLEEKAAKLAYFLISNHCFVDGNKRIGLYVMLVFLELNACELDFTQQELIDLGLVVASGTQNDEGILKFIRKHRKGSFD